MGRDGDEWCFAGQLHWSRSVSVSMSAVAFADVSVSAAVDADAWRLSSVPRLYGLFAAQLWGGLREVGQLAR